MANLNFKQTYSYPSFHCDMLIFLLIFSSFYFGEKFLLNIGIKISPFDIVLLCSITSFLILHRFKWNLNGVLISFVILSLLNVIIEFLSVIFIDAGEPRNITLAVALIRNIILVLLIAQLNFDLKKGMSVIIVMGVINSLIALVFYFKAFLNYRTIILDQTLWEPGIFYSLDQGILRLQGLKDDPNFYFVVNLIPLNFAFFLLIDQKKVMYFVSCLIIFISSIFTFSRSGLLILFLMFILFVGMRKNFLRKFLILFFVLGFLFIFTIFASLFFENISLIEIILYRFERGIETGGSGRLHLWEAAWRGFEASPIWGKGGRYVLESAGNYVHNDWLEMLSSHGIVGLFLIILLYTFVIIYIFKKKLLQNKLYRVVIHLFFLLLFMSTFFTIYYNPYIWFSIGLIFKIGKEEI